MNWLRLALCAFLLVAGAAPAVADDTVSAVLLPNGKQQFLDANGAPLAGGSVFMYVPGTSTLKNTWQDAGQNALNTNPIVLDAAGEASIYGVGNYQQVVYDVNSNLIWNQTTYGTIPNINGTGVGFGPQQNVTANATTDLATATTQNAVVTGTATITSFAANASTSAPIYLVRFASAGTVLTAGASILIPGGLNITTTAGDFMIASYAGSGVWRILSYARGNGQALSMAGAEATVASAATTDLGSTEVNTVVVTGSTTITSFGSSASLANPIYFVRFTGNPQLTQGGNLSLPGSASIKAKNGDSITAQYLGAGSWKVVEYQAADGLPPVPTGGIIGYQIFTSSGSWSAVSWPGVNSLLVEGCGGGGGGGASGTTGSGQTSLGGGGAAGGYFRALLIAGAAPFSFSVTIGPGGASNSAGSATSTSGGLSLTANGGSAGTAAAAASTTQMPLGGAGGTASGGDTNLTGNPGGSGLAISGGLPLVSGHGGSALYGSGGQEVTRTTAGNTVGNAGGGFCSGGSGGVTQGTAGSAAAGGAGANGLVIVWALN